MSAAWILNLTSSFEPSLSLRYADYMNAVSRFLHYGNDYTALVTADQDAVDDQVQSGLRRFYFEHDWSFLEPITTLTTVASDKDYDTPDDFGGTIYGDMTFPANEGPFPPVVQVGEGQIRRLWQESSSTARPRLVAVRALSSDGSSGQRWEILLYPIPDAVYTLTYQYPALKNKLSENKPYPLGGMAHAETLREACLAAAETGEDDEIGIHEARYQAALRRSIVRDNDIRTPPTLGFNRDRGDGRLSMAVPQRFARHNGQLSVPT